jgi:hypothetical protein
MKEILLLLTVFLIGVRALAGSTHSRLATPAEFLGVPMICSPFSNGRAASVVIGDNLVLSAAHIFFDEGPWKQLLKDHDQEIRTHQFFEINGAVLKEPKLQEVFLNLHPLRVRRMFVPLGWQPFADEKIKNDIDSEGQEIPKKDNAYDIILLELEEAHGLPALNFNYSDEVGSSFTIAGYGPEKRNFKSTKKSPNACQKPIPEKRIATRENITASREHWEMLADDETVKDGRPGTTKGDSGGPLLDSQNQVIGIASFIRGYDEQPEYASGFTRLNDPKVKAFLEAVFIEIHGEQ